MDIIAAIKNNKICHTAHVWQIMNTTNAPNCLVRLEAESRRRNWNYGKNLWDVFYETSHNPERQVVLRLENTPIAVDFDGIELPATIGKRGGRFYNVYFSKSMATPLGVERELEPALLVRVKPEIWMHDKQIASDTLGIIRGGFGNHGEYLHLINIEQWVEKLYQSS